MMIPYWTLLIPYVIGIAFFATWMAFNVWHLIKFGFFDFVGKINLFMFIGVSCVLVGFSIAAFWTVPWTDTFDILQLPGMFIPLPSSFEPASIL